MFWRKTASDGRCPSRCDNKMSVLSCLENQPQPVVDSFAAGKLQIQSSGGVSYFFSGCAVGGRMPFSRK